ncbi:tryptophan synthase subunit alpha [Hydrogenimonas urashimensis]|uniref:tryptophan synthase subunit alpha n=1 Tax=Hydrogenimonas urashimensis TaxID=2740515 RepID=UPI00191618FC|nr:tryptophan synthase subunit alpha [Hydrogenimonas urashimensis]
MKKLVAYITTGYPDKDFTVDLALSLKESGVDSLELGIPFSDPVADGPVIEAANLFALRNGFRMEHLLEVSEKIAPEIDTLWMGYFNPFYHRGIDFFLEKAKRYGVSGFIIPDLPHEEGAAYRPQFDEKDVALIEFVAPTDSRERIAKIVKDARKFIYMVAYAGITGAEKSESLEPVIAAVREHTDTPLYIGFGVNEKTAKEKAKGVDGVIVGSAFVRILLKENLTNTQKIDKISTLARTIKEMINE